MKLFIKTTVMAAMVLFTTIGMANEMKSGLTANEKTKSLVLRLEANTKITSVLFIDSEDNIIYSEKVSGKTSYFKKFDLVNLKSGTYFFITKDDLRVIKYTVVVDGSDIVIRDKKERTKPFFRRKGAMLYLNLLNLDMGEVQIKVYDSDNRIVFKEILESQLVVEKAFNFKKAFQDNYTVAVTNGNATYYENILVK